uniref:Uncharacterized protein n=1 Tax=Neobodo designis TaxID=312471 RepID=A0A7S1PSV0_NEODS|mmetsp:Transcript_18727/g.58066  ORF Transcript_18727/g.58066 Transcript_18727/m.58066 type:complete len:108 (+) Transcript_18727:120-443(+)
MGCADSKFVEPQPTTQRPAPTSRLRHASEPVTMLTMPTVRVEPSLRRDGTSQSLHSSATTAPQRQDSRLSAKSKRRTHNQTAYDMKVASRQMDDFLRLKVPSPTRSG